MSLVKGFISTFDVCLAYFKRGGLFLKKQLGLKEEGKLEPLDLNKELQNEMRRRPY